MTKLGALLALVGMAGAMSGSAETADPAAGGQWVPVPAQSLEVPAGSPLDFSGLVPPGPAGDKGPLRIAADGTLRFAGDQAAGNQAGARFNCGMLAAGAYWSGSFPSHAEADALVEQLRRHGYTLIRLHLTDYRLLPKVEGGDIDPDQLDRFYYLLGALKRGGIYWMVDILSKGSRELRGQDWKTPSSIDDLRVRMNFDPAARALWLKFVDTVFTRTNPYTGASTLSDPALAFVVGANENSIGFFGQGSTPFPTGLDSRFDQWVRQHFTTPGALQAALPDLSPAERSGSVPIALPAGWRGTDPRTKLMLRFVADLEVDTYGWMQAALRQRGFGGPLLGSNDWFGASSNLTRGRLPIIDVHAYLGEVTSFAVGSKFFLPSSTSDQGGLGPWMLAASARWLDRPFVASEYGAAFPNPYRHESGLVFPALAAFQGYGTICRNASQPVETAVPDAANGRSLRAYSIGLDPIERANETLAALLFYRGDVSPASRTVAVPFGEPEFSRPGSSLLPREASRAALLARFGLIAPDKVATLPAGTQVAPIGATPYTIGEKVVAQLTAMVTGDSDQRLERLVQALRASGALSSANRTDIANRVFESDTDQLTLDQPHGLYSVITPRTEAVSVTAAASAIALGAIRIDSVDAGALVSASSLDGKPVESSRRLLLVLAGDATNSGMQLGGTGVNRTLQDWGKLPIMMRRVIAEMSLRGPATAAQLTVLSLRGTPIAQHKLAIGKDGVIRFRLDTAAVAGSPTTYFLLERS